LWFELATLLGGTVDELQRRMTPREFQKWGQYRAIWGPLDMVRRYDRPAALIAAALTHAENLKGFLPWPERHYNEAELFARELMGYG
jgi:hypothetical protein